MKKITEGAKIKKLLLGFYHEDLLNMTDPNHFFDRVGDEIALHHHMTTDSNSFYNGDSHWELGLLFETGIEVGLSLKKGEIIFWCCFDKDDLKTHCRIFWFKGESEDEIITKIYKLRSIPELSIKDEQDIRKLVEKYMKGRERKRGPGRWEKKEDLVKELLEEIVGDMVKNGDLVEK
jgi:hypothetical protein